MIWLLLLLTLTGGIPAMPQLHLSPIVRGDITCPAHEGEIQVLHLTVSQVAEFPEQRCLEIAWEGRLIALLWTPATGHSQAWLDLDGDGKPDEHFASQAVLEANYPQPCDMLARVLTIPQVAPRVPAGKGQRL